MNDNQIYIQNCFMHLIKHNKIKESDIKISGVTDEKINALQKKIGIEIPEIYRDFLKVYYFDFNKLSAVIDEQGYFKELYVMIFPNKDDNFAEILDRWKFFEDEYKLLSHGYLPIGDWGYGWGPLCIDTNKALNSVKYDDYNTWNLVWFDHEYFRGGAVLEDYIEASNPGAPDFKEFMAWYFLDKYRDKY